MIRNSKWDRDEVVANILKHTKLSKPEISSIICVGIDKRNPTIVRISK